MSNSEFESEYESSIYYTFKSIFKFNFGVSPRTPPSLIVCQGVSRSDVTEGILSSEEGVVEEIHVPVPVRKNKEIENEVMEDLRDDFKSTFGTTSRTVL